MLATGLMTLFLVTAFEMHATPRQVQHMNRQLRRQCGITCEQKNQVWSGNWSEKDGCRCENHEEQAEHLSDDLKTVCARACEQKNLRWNKAYDVHRGCACVASEQHSYTRFVEPGEHPHTSCHGYPLTVDAQGVCRSICLSDRCTSSYTNQAP